MTTTPSENGDSYALLHALVQDAQYLVGETTLTNLDVICWEGVTVIVHNRITGRTAISNQLTQDQKKWSEWRYCGYPIEAIPEHRNYEA